MTTTPEQTSPSTATGTSVPVVPHARRALLAAVLAFFLITLDATIVNVTLPSIRASLGGGATALTWIVDGYTLPFAGLLLGAGALTDRLGAKRVLGLGVAGFAIASGLCAAAPGVGWLVGARVVQGAFAAVVTPSSMALVRHNFPDASRRARAVSWWAMGGAVAAAAGPVLGGVLAGLGWRLVFAVNLPVAVVCLFLLRGVGSSPKHSHRFDWAGQGLGVVAITGVVLAAVESGSRGVLSPVVLVSLLVAVLAALGFWRLERQLEHPLLPPELFAQHRVAVCVAIGFTFMAAFFGAPFVMSLDLQQARGLSPLATGLVFVPMAVSGALLTPLVPRVVERTGPRMVVISGQVLLALSLLGLGLAPADAPLWAVAAIMIPVGLTAPFINPPTTAVLLDAVPATLADTAGGVYNTARQVGGALAVAVFGSLLATAPTLTSGRTASMVLAAAAVLATTVASRALPSRG